ncbi:MAG: M48 family metallopeptidase [Clostridia bacterium]
MQEIEYKGEKIPYTLIKSRIKNMYIHIKDGNVIVKAPNRLKEKYIYDFVNRKAKWIYEKVKESKTNPKIQEKIEQEDMERLSKIVEESVRKYSITLGVAPKKVRIKDIKYAWGSCSSKRNISINMHLAKKEEKVIEYVVLHEICHLVYMNHSKDFWNLVEKHMPRYKEYKKMLSR